MKIHEKYIKRCIELAKKGLNAARPNPSVGCVIVYQNTILGEGYTSPYGGSHAEVNAINAVSNKKLLKKATLYVSLEPCNHFGKTPPCSDLIIKHQIKRVVVGCIDPFAKVAGAGIEKLKSNGCEVIVGVLEKKCIAVNKRFFTFHTKNRPYIILKWAETQDGFIDKVRNDHSSLEPNWITNRYSRQLVHKWRSEEDALLIGTNTALNDNPKLNVRDWMGKSPIRIVLDRELRIPKSHHIYNGTVKTLILTELDELSTENITFERIDFSKNLLQQVLTVLKRYNIQSLFIEGGKQTLQTFIDSEMWDEARVFKGEVYFEDGLEAPIIKGEKSSSQRIGSDLLEIMYNNNA